MMDQLNQTEAGQDAEKTVEPIDTSPTVEEKEEVAPEATSEALAAVVANPTDGRAKEQRQKEERQKLHAESSTVVDAYVQYHEGQSSGRTRRPQAERSSIGSEGFEQPDPAQITREIMVLWLCTRTPSELKTLITTVKATPAVTEQANHQSRVAELVEWADREGSYGLHQLYSTAQVVLVNFGVLMGDRIGEETLRRVKDVYCAPAPYGQAERLLETHNLLLLIGPDNYGKRATALHLLAHRGRQAVAELAPGLTIEVLFDGIYQSGSGYLADTLPFETVTKLKRGKLDQLSHRLKRLGVYVVVTIEQSMEVDADVRADYGCFWNELPDAEQTMQNLLAVHLEGEVEAGIACWEKLRTQEVLQNATPREMVQAAELIALVVKGQLEESEALARLHRNTAAEVTRWFEHNTDLKLRTFMIAAAVLNGCSFRTISAAGDLLLQRIRPKEAEEKDEDLFVRTRDWIERCHLQLTAGYAFTEYGQTPVPCVELQNTHMLPRILAHVWKEYGKLCDPLLKWLIELAEESDMRTRVRVAAAIGELSVHDFSTIHRLVLDRWARHPDPLMRALPAVALSIPVAEGSLTPQVLRLLHYWSTVDNLGYRWSAAIVYGGYIGQRYPETALRDLLLIAQSGNVLLFTIASESIVQLFCSVHELPSFAATLCDRLMSMTRHKAPLVVVTGLLIFLQVAAKTRTSVSGDADGGEWPSLLYLAEHSEIFRKQIVHLLRSAINHTDTQRIALDVLRNWLQEDDDDQTLIVILGQICWDLAKQGYELYKTGNRQEFERLFIYLGQWAEAGNPMRQEANASRKILELLSEYYHTKRT